jgi:hypothetical protein
MSQRTIVEQAILQVLNTVEFAGKVELTKEQTSQVLDIVAAELVKQNEIKPEAMAKFKDIAGVRAKYASGLLNDNLRKNPRVNGGIKYEAKNPGSRSKDEALAKAKKDIETYTALIAKYEDSPEKIELIIPYLTKAQDAYEARMAELNALKAKTGATIDMSILPEDLQEQLLANS